MDAEVDAALRRLVERGDLTPEQADLVRRESARESARESPGRGARSVGRIAEAAAYAGGVVAAAAGVALGSRFWPSLAVWAQVAVLGLVAVVLWAAGHVVIGPWGGGRGLRGRAVGGPAGRLGGTLWLASTAATSAAVGLATDGLLGAPAETVALVVGLVLLAQGLLLWRLRRGALQLPALYAGALTTAFAALEHLPRPPEDLYALLGWAIGVGGMILTWGRLLQPPRAAYAMGAIVALLSAQILAFDLGGGAGLLSGDLPGLALGLATSVALLALARVVAQSVLTGLGAAGLAIMVPQLLAEVFPGSVTAPAVLFLAGVGLLAAALVAIRSDDEGDGGDGDGGARGG